MKAIIVDDEPKAIELLTGYLRHFNSIELIGTFRNGLKALEYLKTVKVDLAFLDVNMPHLSGLALSKILDPDIKIIFTTAYSEHAAESYEVDAVDYLLKPISFERFAKAMSKVASNDTPHSSHQNQKPLLIKSGTKIHRLNPEDVLYLEKDGNYMTYHLRTHKVIARESVPEALARLPAHFRQCHKSFIVNTHEIQYVDKDRIAMGRIEIPIGASYKDELMRVFGK